MTQLATLNKYFKKYKFHFLFGVLFVILTNYFRILTPQLTGYVVNAIVNYLKIGDAVKDPSIAHNYDFLVVKIIGWFNEKPFQRDRKSTRLNSSHRNTSRMPSSA